MLENVEIQSPSCAPSERSLIYLDGGPAPYIIMPFMANGSLLAYLRKNRKTLVLSCNNSRKNNGDDVSSVHMYRSKL